MDNNVDPAPNATDNTAATAEEKDTALLDTQELDQPGEQQPIDSTDDGESGDEALLSIGDDDADEEEAKDGKTKEDGEKKDDAPAGAPEVYQEFTLPEGFTLEGEMLEQATTLFRELDLPQDKAQKLVDYYTKRAIDEKSNMLADLAEKRKTWRNEVRNRPDFEKEKALARRGIREIVTDPDERELFNDSWMSDHPALWKMFVKVGRLVSEDSMPKGGGNGSPPANINMRRFPQN